MAVVVIIIIFLCYGSCDIIFIDFDSSFDYTSSKFDVFSELPSNDIGAPTTPGAPVTPSDDVGTLATSDAPTTLATPGVDVGTPTLDAPTTPDTPGVRSQGN